MSEYRQVHRSFWESPTVEGLDPIEKLLYIYLISAPQSNMEGLYRLSLKRMALETGIDRDMCEKVVSRLEDAGLGGWFDSWACVTQAVKHMPKSPQMQTHARTLYDSVPDHVMRWATNIGYRMLATCDTVSHTRLDKTKQNKEKTTPRYDNLVKKYGKSKVDDMLETVDNYCASKGKRYKDKVATAANWLKRDGVATSPGYGIPKRPAAPTVCRRLVQSDDEEMATVCLGKVKSTHDEALCMTCGRQWRLLNDLWVEVSDE